MLGTLLYAPSDIENKGVQKSLDKNKGSSIQIALLEQKILELEKQVAELKTLLSSDKTTKQSSDRVTESEGATPGSRVWLEGAKGWAQTGDSLYPNDNNWLVGIGTTSPDYKLDVQGTGQFTGALTIGAYTLPNIDGTNGYVLKTNGTGTITWQAEAAGADNDWVRGETPDIPDTVLCTYNYLGLARGGANNVMYGSGTHTHINFGVACTTGLNSADWTYCTVGGGVYNTASGGYSGTPMWNDKGYTTVGGGYSNHASGAYATICGGIDNTTSGAVPTICGGYYNSVSSGGCFIGGGFMNTISNIGDMGTIGGGSGNSITRYNACIAGGISNTVNGDQGFVGGGLNNIADFSRCTVCGGGSNTAGGAGLSGGYSFVGGGQNNTATGTGATAGWATVAGGRSNTASGNYSAIAGGYADTVSGAYSAVPGGYHNVVAGDYAFGFGYGVNLAGTDDYETQFYSSGNPGKFGINRNPTTYALEVGGNASKDVAGDWLAHSDRRIKTNITPLSNSLDKILSLNPVRFRYTNEYLMKHPSVDDHYYYNFIAQEYQKTFPEAVLTDANGYLMIDTHPVKVALVGAMQELSRLVDTQNEQIAELEARIRKLEGRLASE